MDDLPDLPFELVLSFLSLKDLLRSRAVSRAWRDKIDTIRVKSLCYSNRPSWFTKAKSRLVSGAFAQNFIGAPQFEMFVNIFRSTILSKVKHLRLCCFRLDDENRKTLPTTLERFSQLEELALFRFTYSNDSRFRVPLKLDLPTIERIHVEYLAGIQELTLNAPKLRRIKIEDCLSLRLHLVHAESVERLTTDHIEYVDMQQLKNLRYLYNSDKPREESLPFLFALEQLEEIHLNVRENVPDLFEQKRIHGRTNLKIFLGGLLLTGPKDPNRFNCFNEFDFLAQNHSKLATEIPFHNYLLYKDIERVPAELSIDVLKRFTGLNEIRISRTIQDIVRFFEFLKHLDTFAELEFWCDQPQELFDQLPEHCAARRMTIDSALTDFSFLFRLKKLVSLWVRSIDLETASRILRELDLLAQFKFTYISEIEIRIDQPNKLQVLMCGRREVFSDLDSVIEFLEKQLRFIRKK